MNGFLEFLLLNSAIVLCLAVLFRVVEFVIRRPQIIHALWLIALLKLLTPTMISVPIVVSLNEPSPPPPAPAEPVPMIEPVPPSMLVMPTEEAATVISTETQTADAPVPFDWPLLFFWTWAGGTGLCVLLIVRRVGAFHRLIGISPRAGEELRETGDELAGVVGVRRCPEMRLAEAKLPPLLWPVGKLRLLLPNALLARLGLLQTKTLLVHELTHVKRRDHWVRWVETVVLVLYWWNPIAWWVCRRLRIAEEQCCDQLAVRTLDSSPGEYAETLLAAADFLAEAPHAAPALASGLSSGGTLKRRCEMILKTKPRRDRVWRLLTLALGIALLPFGAELQADDKTTAKEKALAESIRTDIQRIHDQLDAATKRLKELEAVAKQNEAVARHKAAAAKAKADTAAKAAYSKAVLEWQWHGKKPGDVKVEARVIVIDGKTGKVLYDGTRKSGTDKPAMYMRLKDGKFMQLMMDKSDSSKKAAALKKADEAKKAHDQKRAHEEKRIIQLLDRVRVEKLKAIEVEKKKAQDALKAAKKANEDHLKKLHVELQLLHEKFTHAHKKKAHVHNGVTAVYSFDSKAKADAFRGTVKAFKLGTTFETKKSNSVGVKATAAQHGRLKAFSSSVSGKVDLFKSQLHQHIELDKEKKNASGFRLKLVPKIVEDIEKKKAPKAKEGVYRYRLEYAPKAKPSEKTNPAPKVKREIEYRLRLAPKPQVKVDPQNIEYKVKLAPKAKREIEYKVEVAPKPKVKVKVDPKNIEYKVELAPKAKKDDTKKPAPKKQ